MHRTKGRNAGTSDRFTSASPPELIQHLPSGLWNTTRNYIQLPAIPDVSSVIQKFKQRWYGRTRREIIFNHIHRRVWCKKTCAENPSQSRLFKDCARDPDTALFAPAPVCSAFTVSSTACSTQQPGFQKVPGRGDIHRPARAHRRPVLRAEFYEQLLKIGNEID